MNYRVVRPFRDLDGRWKKIGEVIEIKDPARATHLRTMRVIAMERASIKAPERAVEPKHEQETAEPYENASSTGELKKETVLEPEPPTAEPKARRRKRRGDG